MAAIALADKQYDRCSDFLKAALTAQPAHLDIRALYTYFSVEVNNLAGAKEFAVATLKDHNKTDTYAMSAMAHLLYQQARDSRASKPEEVKERLSRFYRANEAFDRVLQLDPTCAYAASGIAIALAENNLGSKVPTGQANLASNEAAQRSKNLRDALSILNKVREVANNGNVYVNIGLCHFQREEFERAIESVSNGCLLQAMRDADILANVTSSKLPILATIATSTCRRSCIYREHAFTRQRGTSPLPYFRML